MLNPNFFDLGLSNSFFLWVHCILARVIIRINMVSDTFHHLFADPVHLLIYLSLRTSEIFAKHVLIVDRVSMLLLEDLFIDPAGHQVHRTLMQ